MVNWSAEEGWLAKSDNMLEMEELLEKRKLGYTTTPCASGRTNFLKHAKITLIENLKEFFAKKEEIDI